MHITIRIVDREIFAELQLIFYMFDFPHLASVYIVGVAWLIFSAQVTGKKFSS